jgi:hypothetical protein
MVNKGRFGIGRKTGLSIDRDLELVENVNVLSLNMAMPPFLGTVL